MPEDGAQEGARQCAEAGASGVVPPAAGASLAEESDYEEPEESDYVLLPAGPRRDQRERSMRRRTTQSTETVAVSAWPRGALGPRTGVERRTLQESRRGLAYSRTISTCPQMKRARPCLHRYRLRRRPRVAKMQPRGIPVHSASKMARGKTKTGTWDFPKNVLLTLINESSLASATHLTDLANAGRSRHQGAPWRGAILTQSHVLTEIIIMEHTSGSVQCLQDHQLVALHFDGVKIVSNCNDTIHPELVFRVAPDLQQGSST